MPSPRFVRVLAALVTLATTARAQDSAQTVAHLAEVRAMVEHIARERPPQAENAARELLRRLQIDRSTLDSLRQSSIAEYWGEVAQLTVQQQMLSQMLDSMRQQLMAQMFGAEARARALQRDYRRMMDTSNAGRRPLVVVNGEPISETESGRERAIREQLQTVLERHFVAEDSLRALEIADVERRLAQVRAETVRRRRDRVQLVRQMVEEVLRSAQRPE
jgi:carboxylesterase type B